MRVSAILCVLAVALLALAAPAGADLFGPISLASEGTVGSGRPQQAEYAHDAAISGDGRYVAFDGSVGGVTGVWRRDVATGAVEEVAGGDAELPSISENGRYISFTTTADLVPQDEARGPNVWVRDMAPGPGEPEYVLASAATGSTKGLTYAYPSNPAQEEQRYGAVAAGRSAISADGQEVAFVTTAVSDLVETEKDRAAGAKGEPPPPETPALQVAVRYLQSDTTRLVSGVYREGRTTAEPVSGGAGTEVFGAVYPGSSKDVGFGPPPADGNWAEDPPPGASLSADGSTVAWMGEDVDEQAPMLPAETRPPLYTEPLWRRIAPGSETPTERVTGGSDPADPACVAGGEGALPPIEAQSAADPCLGPFEVGFEASATTGSRGIWSEAGEGGEGDFVPRLSGDGYTVAFLASAVPASLAGGFGLEPEGEPADLYVADMGSNPTRLTRKQALTPLTEVGGKNVAADSAVTDFAISANGEQVAFTTRRSELALGSPAYVSAPAAEPGESELFDVDLHDDTLTRVTHGYEGEPSEQTHGSVLECPGAEDAYCNPITVGAQSPSLSDNGNLLAFSSTASNLAYGDGNSPRNPFGTPEGAMDGSDAFLVERVPAVSLPTPQYISPPPSQPSELDWHLGATGLSRSDGSVVLYVEAPGPGTLYAAARGSVLVRFPARAVARRHGRASRRADPRETVATRTLATSSERLGAGAGGGGEVVEVVLRLAQPYAPLASRSGGLSAEVSLTCTSSGHPALHQSIAVTFLRTTPAHASRRSRAGVRRRRARR